MKKPIDELRKRLVEVANLSSMMTLADWDQSVNLPPKATEARAASMAELGSVIHSKFIDINKDGLLSRLKKQLDSGKLKSSDKVTVFETWRKYEREKKLPDAFVRELTETTSKAHSVWAEARKKNDFKMFLPSLSKIVELKRKEAKYIGYKNSPYDALLDGHEPDMTSAEASIILNDLKDFLVPFIKNIRSSKIKIDTKKLQGKYPIEKQMIFNEGVIKKLGFDMDAGRVDKSLHPFSLSLHPKDVRITSRYSEDNFMYSLGSTIHETGHALYDQGLPAEHFGTPLGDYVSLSIHESQSRMMENLVGLSFPFWKHFYPTLQKQFPKPLRKIPLGQFYKIINEVGPSFIRTESDEVTYNLHVILRFEIEKEMIEGSISLKDLPEIWNTKMKEYLGVKVPSDTLGVLQDVHWSAGLFGYFPTYSFGNLYSAQFYSTMQKNIRDMDGKMAKGDFKPVREWLRKHIHSRGKTYTASQLVKKVTGESLNSRYFTEYLEKKYKDIYNI